MVSVQSVMETNSFKSIIGCTELGSYFLLLCIFRNVLHNIHLDGTQIYFKRHKYPNFISDDMGKFEINSCHCLVCAIKLFWPKEIVHSWRFYSDIYVPTSH